MQQKTRRPHDPRTTGSTSFSPTFKALEGKWRKFFLRHLFRPTKGPDILPDNQFAMVTKAWRPYNTDDFDGLRRPSPTHTPDIEKQIKCWFYDARPRLYANPVFLCKKLVCVCFPTGGEAPCWHRKPIKQKVAQGKLFDFFGRSEEND